MHTFVDLNFSCDYSPPCTSVRHCLMFYAAVLGKGTEQDYSRVCPTEANFLPVCRLVAKFVCADLC